MDQERLAQREATRYRLFRALYDALEGQQGAFVNYKEVAEEAGIPYPEARAALDYLIGEGLIEAATLGGGVSLTHDGIVEMEDSIRRPSESTEHFEPHAFAVYNQTFNGPVGAVQTGAQSVAHVSQTVHNDVRTLIQSLRQQVGSLPEDKQDEAREHLDELDDQVAKPNRRRATVQMLLTALGSIFVSAVGSGAGNVLTEIGKKLLH